MALFTALIAPYFIDWTAYKRDFELQATRILGQPVTVDGEAHVRLLPLPSIYFADISVGLNADGAPLMTARRFSANVELMPFLSGEVRVVDMALENPVVDLEIGEQGDIAWTERQELLVNPEQVKLDRLTVSNAALNIKGLSPGHTIHATGFDAIISAKSLLGPWKIDADGLIDDVETDFAISTGKLQEAGTIRVRMAVRRLDQPYKLELGGPVGLEDGVLNWKGSFSLGPVLAQEREGMAALPVHTEGDFLLSPTHLSITEYRTEIGPRQDPFVLTGRGEARLKDVVRFRLEVDGRQMDLERLAQMRGEAADGPANLEQRIKVLRGIINQVPVPGFDGEISLEIPAIVAGDTLIREISALIAPFGEGWEVRRLNASLPGKTLVEANGRLGIADEFGFHGKLLVASRQPSGFAAWAAGEVDPALRQLKSIGFDAYVTFTESQITFEELELLLGNNKLTGRVQRIAPVNGDDGGDETARPALVAEIAGDHLRLDDLRASLSLATGGKEGFADQDLDIALKAGLLEAFDLTAGGVDVRFRHAGGELSITQLSADDFLGASIKSHGQITSLLNEPSGNLTLAMEAENAVHLINLARGRLGEHPVMRALAADPELTGGLKLNVELDARATDDGSRGRVIVDGSVGGTQLTVRGGFSGRLSDPGDLEIDLSFESENDDQTVLLRQMGADEIGFSTLFGSLDGSLQVPLTVSLESTGNGAEGYSTVLSGNTADTSFLAKGIVLPAFSGPPRYEFDLTIGSANIAPYATAFGYPVYGLNAMLGDTALFSLDGRLQRQTAEDNGAEYILRVDEGQLAGNGFSGSLTHRRSSAGRPRTEGELQTELVSLPLLAELVYGEGGLARALEDGWWPSGEFGAAAFTGHDAELTVSADKAWLGADPLAQNVGFNLTMSDGDIALSNARLDWLSGMVAGSADFKNSDGTGLFEASFEASDLDLARVLAVAGAPSFAQGRLALNGTLGAGGKSAEALVGALSGSGTATVSQGSMKGVNPSALTGILEVANQEGFEVSAASTDPLATKMLAGIVTADELAGAWSVNRGIMQIRNLALSGDGWDARFGGGAALSDGNADASLTVTLDPGKHKVTGGAPEATFSWTGPIGSPELAIDSQSLQGYLAIRAFEAEQRRVELLQASILEKLRLRHEIVKSNHRERQREIERLAALQRQLEEERHRAEEAARRETKRLEAERVEAERLEAERREAEQRALQHQEGTADNRNSRPPKTPEPSP